jgi:hypothetical protein
LSEFSTTCSRKRSPLSAAVSLCLEETQEVLERTKSPTFLAEFNNTVASAIFLKKLGSGTPRVTKIRSEREWVSYTDIMKRGSGTPLLFASFRETTSGTAFRRFPSQNTPDCVNYIV